MIKNETFDNFGDLFNMEHAQRIQLTSLHNKLGPAMQNTPTGQYIIQFQPHI